MEPTTRLESVEEIMQAAGLLQGKPASTEEPGPFGLREDEPKVPLAKPVKGEPQPFRPTRRPPLALLCVLDDGNREWGEWVRVRTPRFVIGRTEGDLVLPHDDAISGKHAEIVRVLENGRHRWFLNDLNSTNGTFVRVSRSILKNGQEFLVGSYRLSFQIPTPAISTPGPQEEVGTRSWQAVSIADLTPALVEMTPRGPGQRYPLTAAETWIGQDARQATVALAGDPFVSPRHAKVFKDNKNRWWVENQRTMNGTWLRVDKLPLDAPGQFQVGEQRFLIKFP